MNELIARCVAIKSGGLAHRGDGDGGRGGRVQAVYGCGGPS